LIFRIILVCYDEELSNPQTLSKIEAELYLTL